MFFSHLLRAVVLANTAAGVFATLKASNITALKRTIMLANHALRAKAAVEVFAAKPGVVNPHVTSTDAALFASALLGPSFGDRQAQDFKKKWRASVGEAVGQYLPPQNGVKLFIGNAVENVPLIVDPRYRQDWDGLMRAYAHEAGFAKASQLKDEGRALLYQIALESYAHLKFTSAYRTFESTPYIRPSQIFEIRTDPGTIIIDPEVEMTNGTAWPALVTPSLFGPTVAAVCPDTEAYVSVDGGMFRWQPLKTAFEEAARYSTTTLAIAYHATPS